MDKLDQLYRLAENNGIEIFSNKHYAKKAFSFKAEGCKVISIDLSKISDTKEEQLVLAEEIGHCVTDSFYNLTNDINHTYLQQVQRHENKAHNWALEELVPLDQLCYALLKTHEFYELAEILEISEVVVRQAMTYYRAKNLV